MLVLKRIKLKMQANLADKTANTYNEKEDTLQSERVSFLVHAFDKNSLHSAQLVKGMEQ